MKSLSRFYFILGFVILVPIIGGVVFAPLLTSYSPQAFDFSTLGTPQPPSFLHFLGTDIYGRDIFSRLLYGGRVSLGVALVAVSISVFLGTFLGSMSALLGKAFDFLFMRFVDAMLSFPLIFLLLAVQSVLKRPEIIYTMAIIGFTSWMGIARLVRTQTLSIKTSNYVLASKMFGASNFWILRKHILPNVLNIVLVASVLGMSSAIMTESALSFLGLGVQPPYASWGNMLGEAQDYFLEYPYLLIFPGLCITLTILGFNFLGEALRLYMNPKEK
ncbi:MAG TPA: ABC transporter permease [Thermodesulfobium narugense]|uniref:Peptide/nickel transport system permease protein n=1 Tax=Thermodesulfobium acidiphilum TaxID=1794699 RepID=A0A2R4W0T0_THEAF|nr:ABC transporter permease [Thermodesulfobium acidiphilum]AWB10411.1 peptide/nickel transport system permease protein [Thermodesulfobium acidiphilum]PMP84674.1 MAG: peptide ABC transporter permease [Thermodesulfobium narugense]HEM56421.1 ABC transporter permease [Thermodesulfobium narugense]